MGPTIGALKTHLQQLLELCPKFFFNNFLDGAAAVAAFSIIPQLLKATTAIHQ
jgi:hypothetical protein